RRRLRAIRSTAPPPWLLPKRSNPVPVGTILRFANQTTRRATRHFRPLRGAQAWAAIGHPLRQGAAPRLNRTEATTAATRRRSDGGIPVDGAGAGRVQ